ncbi:hypothetical protein [Flavobacterium beibuense]|uniref:hypothetical protein n=1 Tax=Flavobacterium beibuense TaxID=657326 RepID=UPI003A8DB3E7
MADYYNRLVSDHVEQLAREQDRILEAEVINRLADLGHEFENLKDFYLFSSQRLTMIKLEDKPFHNEIRLDYHSENEPGKLIIWWSTEIKIRHEGNKVIATIG